MDINYYKKKLSKKRIERKKEKEGEEEKTLVWKRDKKRREYLV